MVKSQDNNSQEFTWYCDLLCKVYSDVVDAYPAQHRTEFERDLKTIRSRFEHEGISFLTKVLPSLGKAIDTALASGSVLQVPAFKKRTGSSLPRFLGWLIGHVFGSNGVELPHGCPTALGHIRHLCYAFYKLQLPYSDESVEKVLNDFVITDSQLQQNWILTNEDKHVVRGASAIIARVLGPTDPTWIYPRHGPGAVATTERGPGKSAFSRLYRNLEEVYPFTEYFFYSLSHVCDRLVSGSLALVPEGVVRDGSLELRQLGRVRLGYPRETEAPNTPRSENVGCGLRSRGFPRGNLGTSTRKRTMLSLGTVQCPEVLDSSTAKVVLVPKDSRGPRLISMEPLEIQWIQQGQMKLLVETLESHQLTRGQVNFSNQEVNRSLALEASRHGNLVTLDMKDASDRVSQHLVWTLFPLNWVRALEASRSSETKLPSGKIVKLHKFAPMGSAVCFPIEALCFWALAVSLIMTKKPSLTMRQAAKLVWVYGDDIITYRINYSEVMQMLEKVGLLFNQSKCCTSGFFRESCGLDAYKGVVVTPVRIAKRWCRQLVVPTLQSYIEYSNSLYIRGYHKAAGFIEEWIQSLASVPYATVTCEGLCFVRPWSDIVSLNHGIGVRMRFSRTLHRLEVLGWTIRAKELRNDTSDWEELLRSSSSKGSLRSCFLPRQPLRHAATDTLNRVLDRAWALNEKSKGSGKAMKAELYSLRRRVTSTRRWFAIR